MAKQNIMFFLKYCRICVRVMLMMFVILFSSLYASAEYLTCRKFSVGKKRNTISDSKTSSYFEMLFFLDQGHATFMPGAARAVSRFLPCLSWNQE